MGEGGVKKGVEQYYRDERAAALKRERRFKKPIASSLSSQRRH